MALEKSSVRGVTNSYGPRSAIAASNNLRIGISDGPYNYVPKDIAMIGDSRIVGVYNDWSVSVTSPSSIPNTAGQYIDLLGAQSAAALSETGIYEYDHRTRSHRWKLGTDDYGPWTSVKLGRQLIESGSAYRGLRLVVWRPLTKSFQSNVQLSASRTWSYGGWLLNRHGLTPGVESAYYGIPFHRLGVGGSRTLDGVALLPWYKEQAGGEGVDIWWYGTNDIANDVSATSMFVNASTIFDARRNLGRNIVILGEHARWGVDTSTPLTATQQANLLEYNELLAEYAEKYNRNCIYVDTLSLTKSTAHNDLRPQSYVEGFPGMLYDVVHPYLGASVRILPKVIEATDKLLGPYIPFVTAKDDPTVIDFNSVSWFGGTGGTVVSGSSTTGIPDNTNISASASVTAAWNKTYFRSEPGVAVECVYTSTAAASQLTRIYTTSAAVFSLANLGLAVGDVIQLSSLVEIDSIGLGDSVRIYSTFTGVSPTFIAEMNPGSYPGVYRLSTAPLIIPATTTAIQFRCEIYTSSTVASAGTLRFGKFVARKVEL